MSYVSDVLMTRQKAKQKSNTSYIYEGYGTSMHYDTTHTLSPKG
jgi:hypothetical protein